MWWLVLFWVLLIPLLVVMGVVYGTSRKLYRLFYILALFTYVIFIAYIIDVFRLGKQWVLVLLVASGALMLFLGYRLTTRKVQKRRGKKGQGILLFSLFLLLLLVVVLGSFATVKRTPFFVRELPRSSVVAATFGGPRVELGEIAYTNTFFLPAVIPDKHAVACWYNSSAQQVGPQLEVSVDGKAWISDREPFLEVAPGATVKRRFALGLVEKPVAPPGSERLNQTLPRYGEFDAVLLATGMERLSCHDLSDALFNVTILLTD